MVEYIEELLKKYLPVLWLHPSEAYDPTCVNSYLRVAELRLDEHAVEDRRNHKNNYKVLVPKGEVTSGKLAKIGNGYPSRRLQLFVEKFEWEKASQQSVEFDTPPVYTAVKRVLNPAGHLEAYELSYVFFYPFNGAYKLLKAWEVGAHGGDWERLTVRVCPDGDLEGVYYNRHREFDGDWVAAKDVPMKDGRILVFVAKGSHGCYSREGAQPRMFFLLNDHCGKGKLWRPSTMVKLADVTDVQSRGTFLKGKASRKTPFNGNQDALTQMTNADEWVCFKGYFGSVLGVWQDDWFYTAENPISRGWFKRIFCPCWPGPRNHNI